MLHVLEAAKAFKKQQNGAFQGELVFPIDFELPRWILSLQEAFCGTLGSYTVEPFKQDSDSGTVEPFLL